MRNLNGINHFRVISKFTLKVKIRGLDVTEIGRVPTICVKFNKKRIRAFAKNQTTIKD